MPQYRQWAWGNSYKYLAKAGDSFDLIAHLAYAGMSYLSSLLREVNPEYVDVILFGGGEIITIPIIDTVSSELLPPWRQS